MPLPFDKFLQLCGWIALDMWVATYAPWYTPTLDGFIRTMAQEERV